MISVLADDLSGAAELGGIAALWGLDAEVQTEWNASSSAGVIAVDTRTRPLRPSEAAARVAMVLERIQLDSTPEWFYKKTDSVLRGNVRAELEALLRASGKHRVIFVPANPAKGRCIEDGRYLVNGIPLDETVFATDPAHPCRTADVVAALGDEGDFPLRSIKRGAACGADGINIPDVAHPEDLDRRAGEADDNTLLAGAAEFFSSILRRTKDRAGSVKTVDRVSQCGDTSLFVCGSLAAWDRGIARQAEARGLAVLLVGSNRDLKREVELQLRTRQGAMIAIGRPPPGEMERSGAGEDRRLAELVELAAEVYGKGGVTRILVEGGATASALMDRLGWRRFEVVPMELPGVGCLRPLEPPYGPLLLIKPGSYLWPDGAW